VLPVTIISSLGALVSISCAPSDDYIVTGNSPYEIRKTIDYFATEFKKISDLGKINRVIGIDLIRDRVKHTITLSQSPYASQIGAKHSKSDRNSGSKKPKKDPTVPMKPTFDVSAKVDGSNQPIHEEIGQFRYLVDHTRPDLLASVSIMGSGTANPHDEHVKDVRTFAEYIAISHDIGLTLGGEPEVDLFGFSDATYLTKGDSLTKGSRPESYVCLHLAPDRLKIRQSLTLRRKLSSKLLTKRSDRLSGFGTSSGVNLPSE
jgi:hypothetical protein